MKEHRMNMKENPMKENRMKASIRTLTGLAVLLASSTAFAHPGHDPASSGFMSGLLHPLLGLDHLLAMLIVGVWAAQLGARARWAVPAAFIGLMAVGAALALDGLAMPRVEAGVAASLLALGLVVALAWRAALPLAVGLTGGFALFHGAAHGLELPTLAQPLAYVAGFLIATAALHATGYALGALAQRHAPWLARASGWLGVAAGLGYALG